MVPTVEMDPVCLTIRAGKQDDVHPLDSQERSMHRLQHFLDSRLIKSARLLEALTQSARTRLAPTVAEHCWVSAIRGKTLIVVTDSSSWAVPIRYQQHELLKQLNEQFPAELQQTLTRLKIKVAILPNGAKKLMSNPHLSPDNARKLASAADGISDAGLRSALKKLARRGMN